MANVNRRNVLKTMPIAVALAAAPAVVVASHLPSASLDAEIIQLDAVLDRALERYHERLEACGPKWVAWKAECQTLGAFVIAHGGSEALASYAPFDHASRAWSRSTRMVERIARRIAAIIPSTPLGTALVVKAAIAAEDIYSDSCNPAPESRYSLMKNSTSWAVVNEQVQRFRDADVTEVSK